MIVLINIIINVETNLLIKKTFKKWKKIQETTEVTKKTWQFYYILHQEQTTD